MGSNIKGITIFFVSVIFVAVIGILLYTNRGSASGSEEKEASEDITADDGEKTKLVGTDTRAFLEDETFFDSDKGKYSSVERMEGKKLSLLMTSVQKDLRIQIVDNTGKLVTGVSFSVMLNLDKEYVDDNQDGIIYIEYLRAGPYDVLLNKAEGYMVPDTAARIEVKQSVEYAVIDDISLLIFSEDEINAELEDLEIKGASDDADKSEITKIQESNSNAKFGIDVSKWNKEIDWDKVKKAGVEFAVIRVGYRGATTGALVIDPYFEKNMEGALRAGIPVGVYFFTQAMDVVEAVEEASMVASLCKDYDITYPVYIDSESAGGNGRADGLDKKTRTAVCKAFCTTIENAGYRAGVYGARNWFNEMLDMESLKNYIIWLAEYRDVPVFQGYYHMWQYTSGGKLPGIEGKVDFNLSYLKIETEAEEESSDEDTPGEEQGEIVEPKPIEGADNADW